jgi:uncharacterized DUF497 family protein
MYYNVGTGGARRVEFEWDDHKNGRNLAKHGLSFEVGAEIFLDFGSITLEEQFIGGGSSAW